LAPVFGFITTKEIWKFAADAPDVNNDENKSTNELK
jgi:hypothetical protein